MTTSLPTIAIVGAGSMGGAILGGLLSPTVTVAGGIRVTNRTRAKAALVAAPGVTSYALAEIPDANLLAVAGAGIVLLGVKPAMIRDTLAEIAPALDASTLVISVAAGVTIQTMESIVPNPVLRAMPNTPALVGRGVTGLSAGTRSTDAHRGLGRTLFETVGSVLEIPESQIDALSTISGSGPAYVFLLIDELTRTAVRMGFTAEEAATMVNGTFGGAVALLDASDQSPEQLRLKVTSPNGTTERAVAELLNADLGGLFDRATAAALARARELAAG
jgi:pyrroline-5-carboxylate reductase